jgi:hypothetical protein
MFTTLTEVMKTRLEEEKLFLIREHDQDRNAYQKLLTDYNTLEQRSEMLEKEISRLQRGGANASGAKKGHERNLSNASTASATSELPDDVSILSLLISFKYCNSLGSVVHSCWYMTLIFIFVLSVAVNGHFILLIMNDLCLR